MLLLLFAFVVVVAVIVNVVGVESGGFCCGGCSVVEVLIANKKILLKNTSLSKRKTFLLISDTYSI
jgi:hypothetical protein